MNSQNEAGLPSYLAALNKAQREAVYHKGSALLILAGAGSGKTRVITTKIAYMIRELGIKPWSILAVTFTNKAAREMAERARLIEPLASESMMRTFHSFGAWFLRRNANEAGLNSNFNIYDDDDVVSLLASIFADKKKDELRVLAHLISRAKDHNLGPADNLSAISQKRGFDKIYAAYEERLRQTGNVDFGDLIRKPIEILRSNRQLAKRIQNRFGVILVDEYQDANIAQFELLRELTGKDSYVCVVGDDDQSIYQFRGADISNILNFQEHFSGADIIKLEKNYRSTGEILELAHSVVRHNKGRHDKKLEAARGYGKRPKLVFLDTQDEEAEFCARLIKDSVLRKKNTSFADWALLYRVNAQSLGFEHEFYTQRIPYKIVGSLKFYEREEIKDALALLAFMLNPRDEISFRRIINKPARGLGKVNIEKILAERWNENNWDIEIALKRICPQLSKKARSGTMAFLDTLEAGRACLSEVKDLLPGINTARFNHSAGIKSGEGLSFCVATLIERSGLAAYYLEQDKIAGEQRVANLQEFVNTAILYPSNIEGVIDFLERIELDRDTLQNGEEADRVTLITLHNTKGLEFRNVIITGMEQGLFPRAEKQDEELEEERRLFYVGVTRAMDELYLTTCRERRVWGRTTAMEPSLFLREADNSKFDVEDQSCGIASGGFRRQFYTYGRTAKAAQQNMVLRNKPVNAAGSDNKNKISSDGRWSLGDRVFCSDNGYGEICAIKESGDGPVVSIFFETGRIVRFLSAVQSKNYLKIKE
ncbi:MAG: UvrD-helicase domain-containing protein [Termitinemataceae bacterium]|nr:MAG: UvrD-helicase domain-containing protein [Termitinemataceae bacterium]